MSESMYKAGYTRMPADTDRQVGTSGQIEIKVINSE